MKIQKYFEANNEQFGWNEIESMMSNNYEIRAEIDKILEKTPTAKIEVTFNLTIEIS